MQNQQITHSLQDFVEDHDLQSLQSAMDEMYDAYREQNDSRQQPASIQVHHSYRKFQLLIRILLKLAAG